MGKGKRVAEDPSRLLRNAIDRDAMISFLRRALAHPSVQTDLLEDDPQIAQFICDVILPEVQALGPDTLGADAKGNLMAVWGSGEPALALIVYAMTHPQTVMADAFSPRVV